MSARPGAAAVSPGRLVLAHDQAGRVDGEYAGDHWNAERLGERKPDNFFRHVLEHADVIAPNSRFGAAFQRVLDYINQ